ncbi:peptide ABC transporter substrate-binding protein [Corynebacterium meridianum]|uniref:ABC transporter substrate-binding protein n=1 Tax=Corynebacterium meridianum TaxID=2765363 RepID=A0A934I701_9CORY|nr:ABC transporter substrate-binding protein [Corynebacterium meridianum]MBI8988413.1 ABC transporter substrate-binding protein [Corynebacterium meridianum]MCK7678113.1 ABC transporter substrate-binding protein [Corynebacterium meridianum]
MTLKKTIAAMTAAALAVSVSACSSDSEGGSGASGGSGGSNYITAWGSEPQNPLVPQNTNETGGGRIVESIFAGLAYYDAEGKVHNELAESITPEDGNKKFVIKIKEGETFSDGSPVTSKSFVDAWNYAVENETLSSYFFEPIEGYEEGKPLTGLEINDEHTFTVTLAQPEADFPLRLGYSAFYPLPDVAFDDMDAFGQEPIGNGPYKVAKWAHNDSLTMVPNEDYDGGRKVQNDGIEFIFYPKQDAAYVALLDGNLDVLDAIPDSAFANYKDELDGRWANQPSAVFQSFTIPQKLEHFNGEEGQLRREAISMSVNREEITDKIFDGTRTPATDFSSPVIDGHSDSLKGAEVLEYNPEKAKELWDKADAISPWTGQFTISYNADGGHQAWVDAVANSIKNTLGIDAVGNPYPDFKSLRDDVTNRTISGAFRTGWQADYPSVGNFLAPVYATGAGSNDGDYSSKAFDDKLSQAAGASDVDEATKLYNEAQEILLQDLPVIPLWYSNVTAGWSSEVDNVEFGWNSQPIYYGITKK